MKRMESVENVTAAQRRKGGQIKRRMITVHPGS
jgi:hypothetical protein